MTDTEFQILVEGLRILMTQGASFTAPLARTKAQAAGIKISDAWAAIKYGTPIQVPGADDRAGFLYNGLAVVAALSKDGLCVLVSAKYNTLKI
jgi:hypothetical protein